MTGSADQPRLAIIGGGQLGMFLCQAARKLGVMTTVVSPERDVPALAVADDLIVAAFDAEGLASQLAAVADVVTFELEEKVTARAPCFHTHSE